MCLNTPKFIIVSDDYKKTMFEQSCMNPANFLHKEMSYFSVKLLLLLIIISMSEYSVFFISLLFKRNLRYDY